MLPYATCSKKAAIDDGFMPVHETAPSIDVETLIEGL
jgi:hypothetical protein